MSAVADLDLLRRSFIPETRDLLELANEALLALESNPGDADATNRLFRAVHTIKGTAGIFDLPALVHLVHAAEDLLGAIRDGKVTLTTEITDDLLSGLDDVARWIEALDATGAMPRDSAEIARARAARYRGSLARGETDGTGPGSDRAPDAQLWLDHALRQELKGVLKAIAPEAPTVQLVIYEPGRECFFNGEDPLHLLRQVPDLIWLDIDQREPWPPVADFDPYLCVLRLRAMTTASREVVDHLFRYNLAETRIATLEVAELVGGRASAKTGSPEKPLLLSADLPPMLREILAVQERILDLDRPGFEQRLPAVRATVANALVAAGLIARGDEPWSVFEEVARQRSAAPFRAWQERLFHRGAGASAPSSEPEPSRTETAPSVASPDRPERSAERVLKVEQGKIDLMMTLVGELVVAKNALPFLARRAEDVYGSRELAREVKDQYAVIDRIAQEMQGAIMGIRMLPVSEMFKRFPRLVRDIARKLGKSVELVLEGETTEADKNVIEALADPLVHLVRNSLDHGIEMPDERVDAGKPACASLRLRAYQEGDNVCIEVVDDGHGIDPERIKAKALAKGLIDADRAAQLGHQEAIQLIFLPGFSTAEEISDLSGRGVGMDVVRSTVERLGGSVLLHSELGKGTSVRLSLPLSMAVTRVMTVEVEGQLFGVPMELVVETVRVPKSRIQRLKHAETMSLRDTVVPLVRLRRLLAMEVRPREEEAVLVVRVAGVPLGLVIDEFRTGMEVILKPLTGILASMPGYAGTAVLGDGKVLLVLNLKELL